MRAFTVFAFLLCFSFIAKAQETSDKTLVKTLDPAEATSVVIDFKTAQINPQPWDEKAFRIELIVKSNMPIQVLEQLVKAGRYTLEGVKEGEQYLVTAPNMSKSVSVRGKDLEEEIIVVIKTPGAYVLTNNALAKDEAQLAMLDRSGTGTQKAEMMKIKNKVDISNVVLKSTLQNATIDIKLKTGDIVVDGIPVEINN
jgi:hypothetical protein